MFPPRLAWFMWHTKLKRIAITHLFLCVVFSDVKKPYIHFKTDIWPGKDKMTMNNFVMWDTVMYSLSSSWFTCYVLQ